MSTRSGRPTYVLGTGLSHDGSACLLKDGEICVAIEKERLTRVKHDGGNDRDAVAYCLDAEGITIDDVALVVQNANFGMMGGEPNWWGGERLLSDAVPVRTISHHLAHAYSAVGTCPFDDCAVLIIDGCGNAMDECMDLEGAIVPDAPSSLEIQQLSFEKDSYYLYRDGRLQTIYKDFSLWGIGNRHYPMYPNTTLHSLGGLYLGASMYVFNGFEDPGKLMGLAPYGRPGVYDFEIFDLRDGRAFVRYDWMSRFQRPAHTTEAFKEDFSYYADIAWHVQRELERAILYIVKARHELAPAENLTYAGGVALNAVANARILRESPYRRVYMQPAAADNGLAIGCAYYGWLEVLKRERRRHNGSTCFGRRYDRATIDQALDQRRDELDISETDGHVEMAADALASGQTIAWFQGGAEFGPRALGHRSILADPRNAEVRTYINAKIKQREDFRPFAPSVPLDDLSCYFETEDESPYMILVAPVRPEWRDTIPSVVHRDHSARIQTVTAESDPAYYRLLKAFKARTGVSVLLNTSFNKRRMPIVETPAEALGFFLACPLDLLVLDRFVVRKAAVPKQRALDLSRYFAEQVQQGLDRRPTIAPGSRATYQVRVIGPRVWTIDLTKPRPVVIEGMNGGAADIAIELAEGDMQQLLLDPANEGRRLLQQSKVHVEGNQALLVHMANILGGH